MRGVCSGLVSGSAVAIRCWHPCLSHCTGRSGLRGVTVKLRAPREQEGNKKGTRREQEGPAEENAFCARVIVRSPAYAGSGRGAQRRRRRCLVRCSPSVSTGPVAPAAACVRSPQGPG
eukprot:1177371-Prorocentrum_minimum.AAC.3